MSVAAAESDIHIVDDCILMEEVIIVHALCRLEFQQCAFLDAFGPFLAHVMARVPAAVMIWIYCSIQLTYLPFHLPPYK